MLVPVGLWLAEALELGLDLWDVPFSQGRTKLWA